MASRDDPLAAMMAEGMRSTSAGGGSLVTFFAQAKKVTRLQGETKGSRAFQDQVLFIDVLAIKGLEPKTLLLLELGAPEGVVPALAAVLDMRGCGERNLVAALAALQCSRACYFT